MIPDKLAAYKQVDYALPKQNALWPLYGAGFEKLGRDGQPLEVPMPEYGPDELLVRHDAVGLCFSDIKVIRLGEEHPRIHRDMRAVPVVLGHEVCLTVAGVGHNLSDQYHVGDRFIVQADIHVNGVGYAYGYEIQGGLSQYNVIDQRVLNGDDGCYLIPIQPTTGYAEAALIEPWACVEASYNVHYRTQWKEGGTVWIIGNPAGFHLGRAREWRPRRIVLNVSNAYFAADVRNWGNSAGIEVTEVEGNTQYDDVVALRVDAELVERALTRLASGGVLNIATDVPLKRTVEVDVGRLHYNHIAIVGTSSKDFSTAYNPIRSGLKPDGVLWILGAAGPMGQMHLQRALRISEGPAKIVTTNLRPSRTCDLKRMFDWPAQEHDIELICLSHEALGETAIITRLREATEGKGLDDIVVMVPSVPAIECAATELADGGVMNIFAGVPRGTLAGLDMNAVIFSGVRLTGSSGSSIADLRRMRDLVQNQTLSPNRSVAAIAGLDGVAEGLRAVSERRFPGKVAVYPSIRSLPLIPLSELKDTLHTVSARLLNGKYWTTEAENELLRVTLGRDNCHPV